MATSPSAPIPKATISVERESQKNIADLVVIHWPDPWPRGFHRTYWTGLTPRPGLTPPLIQGRTRNPPLRSKKKHWAAGISLLPTSSTDSTINLLLTTVDSGHLLPTLTMGDYYRTEIVDDPRSRRRTREDPIQYRGTVYVASRDAVQPMELARRVQEDSDNSIEEIPRDFPSAEAYYRRGDDGRRGTRSLERGYSYDDNDGAMYAAGAYRGGSRRADDGARHSRRDDRRGGRGRSLSRQEEILAAVAGAGIALGGKEFYDRKHDKKDRPRSRSAMGRVAAGLAGAAAGDLAAKQYVKERNRRHRDDDDDDDPYYGSSDSDDRPRRGLNRRKSITQMGEAALGALGLGAVAGASRGRDRSRRRDRRRGSSSSSYSSSSSGRGRGGGGGGGKTRDKRLQQAAQAALAAAAAEAWRSRNEPGGFFEGEKARRMLTAAVGAGGIDALVEKKNRADTKVDIPPRVRSAVCS